MKTFSTPNDIIAKDWIHLQEPLFKDSYDASINRHRPNYVFRGLSNSNYELETSIYRLQNKVNEMERHLIRNFRKYAPYNSVTKDKLWHWLTLAQHHGLPTRLLDWTFSPYVALHFATEKTEHFDLDKYYISYISLKPIHV